jgi:hypothetical protein
VYVIERKATTMPSLEHKSADAAEVKGGGAVATADPYEFTIIGSVTGLRDEVNDIIEPGAYAATLKRRTPKIIKDLEWGQRLGKVLTIEEYLPGDSRLPKTTAQGTPWPNEAGALVAKVRLFKSTAGREAAERWREYGVEQQYSIGYVVPPGQSSKTKEGVRHIKSLELYEISDVLWGAMPLAGPMPELLATKMLTAIERGEDVVDDPDEDTGPPTIEFDPFADDPETGEPGVSWDEVVEAMTALGVDEAKVLADGVELDLEVKYDTSPVGTEGGRQNWVDKVGGLPAFIRAIAHALIRNGHSEQNAIQIAVGTVKRWASGGGKVTAKTRAKAAAALAEWERKKASSHGKGLEDALDLFGFDPAQDTDCKAANGGVAEAKYLGSPRLPGTLEERQDTLRRAVQQHLEATLADGEDDDPVEHTQGADAGPSRPKPYVCIEGTYLDRVVVSVEDYTRSPGERDAIYEIPYAFTADGGDVTFGSPVPVRLVVDLEPGDGAEDFHLAAMMDALGAEVDGVKTYMAALESKAGRVLSGGNTERIRAAVQALITVLRSAGVNLDDVAPAAPKPVTGATAPVEGKELVEVPDPTDLITQLRAAARG